MKPPKELRCYFCHSSDVSGYRLKALDPSIIRTCHQCQTSWPSNYGFETLEEAEEALIPFKLFGELP